MAGLQALNGGVGDEILLPSYICSVVTDTISSAGFSPVFYDVDDALQPVWDSVQAQRGPRCRAFFLVHYFGIAQDCDRALAFCRAHDLVLIEDNAHGFGAEFSGRPLGTLGHFGIASPRKVLDIRNGGILYCTQDTPAHMALPPAPGASRWHLKRVIKQLLALYPALGQLLKHKPDYLSEYEGREPAETKQLFAPDAAACYKIKNWDSARERARRQACWHHWHRWATINNLEPLTTHLAVGDSPLCFPVREQDQAQRARWFEWGWQHALDVHSWPALPDAVIEQQLSGYRQWQTILCFPIPMNIDANTLRQQLDL